MLARRTFPRPTAPRGVEQHPHRGFETVTIVYAGEVEHRDSSGGGGRIGPGDLQWMTAAAGLVHEEMHGREFTRRGGTLEMIQLWVNLPPRHKTAQPGYQSITAAQIPQVPLADGAGMLRVIAGDFRGTRGPAATFTPINLWDLRLRADSQAFLDVPDGHNTLLFVLTGRVELLGSQVLEDAGLAICDRQGTLIAAKAVTDAKLLVLDGEPIDEPVVAYGPFVMNTAEEIEQAIADFRPAGGGGLRPAVREPDPNCCQTSPLNGGQKRPALRLSAKCHADHGRKSLSPLGLSRSGDLAAGSVFA
jgi:hypothetical protein